MNTAINQRIRVPRNDRPVLGWLSRSDFARAQLRSPRFSRRRHYGDFQIERDAQMLSLAAAGMAPQIQDVPFAAFEAWTQRTGSALDLKGLDEFATHWLAHRVPEGPSPA